GDGWLKPRQRLLIIAAIDVFLRRRRLAAPCAKVRGAQLEHIAEAFETDRGVLDEALRRADGYLVGLRRDLLLEQQAIPQEPDHVRLVLGVEDPAQALDVGLQIFDEQ